MTIGFSFCKSIRCLPTLIQLLTVGVAFTFVPTSHARQAGDVVGRDLNVIGLGWIGHIGMDTNETYWDASTNQSIKMYLEVLNEGTVIVKNTHLNFRSRSPLWGGGQLFARYVANCARCGHNWTQVISAGWEQRNWSPTYTYSAAYTEGKMVLIKGKWVRQNAKYRCDGFIVYSYRKGLGRNVSRTPQTPVTVWNGLPYNYGWDNAA